MPIFIIDLKKRRLSVVLTAIAVALVILLSVAVSVVTKLWGEELYLKAVTEASEERIVIIDPGHGGEDCGAIGINGAYEKDINLSVALLMGEYLQEKGYAVVFTRTEDKLLYLPEENIKGIRKISDLKNRCKVAAEYPTAVFVSIHMNSFGDSRYSGTQVYHSGNDGSYRLATSIQERVRDDLQSDNDRRVKRGEGLYLLENIENDCVIVECGFFSNKVECEKLSQKEYQKQLSFSIVCGIIEYIEDTRGAK